VTSPDRVLRPGDWVSDEDGRSGFVLYTDAGRGCVVVAYIGQLSRWRDPAGLTPLGYTKVRLAHRLHWAIRLRKRLLVPGPHRWNGWVRAATAWLEVHA
jgi:hypothetical protein